MDMQSFAKLEEQVSRAIAHIDKLTGKISHLESDNKELRTRVAELEKELKINEKALAEIETKSARVAEQVKDKVESILKRIDSYEKSDA